MSSVISDKKKGFLEKFFRGRLESVNSVKGPRLEGYVTEFGQDPAELINGKFAVKGIPLLVRACINFLVARVHGQVGLFRKAVALQDVLDLKMRFAQGRIDLSADKDPHEVAAFLKLFFREMPSPLLTTALYDEFVDAAEIDDEHQRVEALKPVLAKLPPANVPLLQYMLSFFNCVASHNNTNKMDHSNLGIIFGPTFLRPELESVDAMMKIRVQSVCVETLSKYFSTFYPSPSVHIAMKELREELGGPQTTSPSAALPTDTRERAESIARRRRARPQSEMVLGSHERSASFSAPSFGGPPPPAEGAAGEDQAQTRIESELSRWLGDSSTTIPSNGSSGKIKRKGAKREKSGVFGRRHKRKGSSSTLKRNSSLLATSSTESLGSSGQESPLATSPVSSGPSTPTLARHASPALSVSPPANGIAHSQPQPLIKQESFAAAAAPQAAPLSSAFSSAPTFLAGALPPPIANLPPPIAGPPSSHSSAALVSPPSSSQLPPPFNVLPPAAPPSTATANSAAAHTAIPIVRSVSPLTRPVSITRAPPNFLDSPNSHPAPSTHIAPGEASTPAARMQPPTFVPAPRVMQPPVFVPATSSPRPISTASVGTASSLQPRAPVTSTPLSKSPPVTALPPPPAVAPPCPVVVPHARAKYPFKARNDTELDMEVGDIIEVLNKHPSGWWQGKSSRGSGLYPSNYAEELV
eukprot:CAMPEP_0177688974 /NCGR_PEP_ID=MMETSP0447-20121125/34929_1 /TAXON_ID=0 /ORGANISM="Stygamoeba regulata, Strain BSH-02190019" /LENGTH=696 /DNA_ID=CAMNT_0019199281 /DNA_START=41 /DNA_END=2131 /DNA_ORIENTATION=+